MGRKVQGQSDLDLENTGSDLETEIRKVLDGSIRSQDSNVGRTEVGRDPERKDQAALSRWREHPTMEGNRTTKTVVPVSTGCKTDRELGASNAGDQRVPAKNGAGEEGSEFLREDGSMETVPE